MSDELPLGWTLTTLGEVAEVHDSRRVPLNQAQRAVRPGPYPYYGANGQVGTIDDFLFEGDHILLAEDGGYFDDPFRPNAYAVTGRFWVNNHAHILRAGPAMLHELLLHALNATDLMPYVNGTTRLKLTQADMRRIPIFLPPLAEQRRIIARIEALLARARRARADLERLSPLAERYRMASLISALSGQTSSVTSNGGGPSQPPADHDLAGVWPFDEIPFGWKWVPFENVLDDETSSHKKLPQKAYSLSGQFPVVDQGEAEIGGWSDDQSLVYSGSLPVIVFGDHTRAVKFIDQRFVQGADGVKVLVPRSNLASARYAYWLVRGLPLPDKGYARHMKFLRASSFPLPPLVEQPVITRRIELDQSASDAAEREAARALSLLDRLERAILAQAFRGELVPQDPADEPAAALLARLRGTMPSAARRGRPRTGVAA